MDSLSDFGSNLSRRLRASRRTSLSVLASAGARWSERAGARLGAGVAFPAMLAVAALGVLALAVTGAVLGAAATRGDLAASLRGVVGLEAASGLQALVESAWRAPHGAVAVVLGVAGLVLGAAGAFATLRHALDALAGPVHHPPAFGRHAPGRFAAFGVFALAGVLVVASLALGVTVAALGAWPADRPRGLATLLALVDGAVTVVVLVGAFAALLRAVPDAPPSPRAAWAGAVFGAVLFALGKLAAALYLARAGLASGYVGAAGSLLVLMLWVYGSTQALLLGASLAAALDARPARATVPVRAVGRPSAARTAAPASLAEARARRQAQAARAVDADPFPWTRAPVQILRFPRERVQQRIDNG